MSRAAFWQIRKLSIIIVIYKTFNFLILSILHEADIHLPESGKADVYLCSCLFLHMSAE